MQFSSLIILVGSACALAASNSDNNLQTILSESKNTIAKKQKSGKIASSQAPKYIISNSVADSSVPLGKYSGEFNVASNSSQCTEGAMYCDYYGNGFWTCAQGSWVYRNCGPGTKCAQDNGSLYCGYA